MKPEVGAADITGIPRDPSPDPAVGAGDSNSYPPLNSAVGAAEPKGSSELDGEDVSKPPLRSGVGDGVSYPVDLEVGEDVSVGHSVPCLGGGVGHGDTRNLLSFQRREAN